MGSRRSVQRFFVSAFAALTLVLAGHPTQAMAHEAYLGSGYWQRVDLTYRDYTPTWDYYYAPTANAVSDWSGWTDVNISSTAPGYEDIAF